MTLRPVFSGTRRFKKAEFETSIKRSLGQTVLTLTADDGTISWVRQ